MVLLLIAVSPCQADMAAVAALLYTKIWAWTACCQPVSHHAWSVTALSPNPRNAKFGSAWLCCACCRYEIDKLTASQRLDLNLEKGRMRDELQALRDKANELEIKMDKETNMLKAAVEQTKNETIKYCLGMMFAFTTAGLGAARLFSK